MPFCPMHLTTRHVHRTAQRVGFESAAGRRYGGLTIPPMRSEDARQPGPPVAGGNVYRQRVSATFEQLCLVTGLPNSALARQLRVQLGRKSLTRQTLRAWRSGEQPVPGEVFLAVVELAGRRASGPLMAAFEDQFARSIRKLRD